MHALLGKITQITEQQDAGLVGLHRLEVSFKASCILPARSKTPEWLKDQVLKVQRDVVDMREVGNAGDSIVLTTAESIRWLYPLAVTPNIAHGALPATLGINLRWWKDENPPEYLVRANARQLSGKFVKTDDGFSVEINTADLFTAAPCLPVDIEVTCDKMKVVCSVLPAAAPVSRKLTTPERELQRLENAWYAIDIPLQAGGGGIISLVEKGRAVDHFRKPPDVVQHLFEHSGHVDRYSNHWRPNDKMNEVAMICAGARHEAGAMRLCLEGVVDEGQNLRTSVAYTLFDDIPLLCWQREFHFHPGAKKDDKAQEEKPKDTIDDVQQLGLAPRAIWMAECDGLTGSRLLTAYDDQLVVARCARANDGIWGFNWRMKKGWIIVEHPHRSECSMYLFDPQTPPFLTSWLGTHSISLETNWPLQPVRPGGSVGISQALTVGEFCGASVDGAWVACRSALTNGIRCAVIARPSGESMERTAIFSLGDVTHTVELEKMLLPGVGAIAVATADFTDGQMDQPFDVTVAGIPSRRLVYERV